jgi:hypothetical protein
MILERADTDTGAGVCEYMALELDELAVVDITGTGASKIVYWRFRYLLSYHKRRYIEMPTPILLFLLIYE